MNNDNEFFLVDNALISLFEGEIEYSLMILSQSPKLSAFILNELINSVEMSQFTPNKRISSLFTFKWCLSAFVARFSNPVKEIIESIPITIIQQVSPNIFNILTRVVSDDNISFFDEKDSLRIIGDIESIREKFPSLLNSSLQILHPIISRIPPEIFFKKIGFSALSFYYFPPIEFLAHNSMIIKDFAHCFSFPQNYSYSDLSYVLQYRITSSFYFPRPFPSADSGVFISLINTSIQKKLFFINIIHSHAKELFLDGQIDSMFTFISIFPDFSTWLFIMLGKNQINNFLLLRKIIKFRKINEETSISLNFLTRVYNDMKLLSRSGKILGFVVTKSDIQKHSLPYLFKNNLNNSYSLKLLGRPFFHITDHDRSIDIDFIRSYIAIVSSIQYLKKRAYSDSNDESFYFEPILSNISAITDPFTKESVLIDIFSLIFLATDDQYRFLSQRAFHILSIIQNHLNNQYINKASHILAEYSNPDTVIAHILKNVNEQFFCFLDNKDYNNAILFVKDNFKLKSVVEKSKIVNQYRGQNDISLLTKDTSIEIFFSISRYDEVDYCQDENINKLLDKRRLFPKPLQPFDSIDSSFYRDIEGFDNIQPILNEYKIETIYPLLNQFLVSIKNDSSLYLPTNNHIKREHGIKHTTISLFSQFAYRGIVTKEEFIQLFELFPLESITASTQNYDLYLQCSDIISEKYPILNKYILVSIKPDKPSFLDLLHDPIFHQNLIEDSLYQYNENEIRKILCDEYRFIKIYQIRYIWPIVSHVFSQTDSFYEIFEMISTMKLSVIVPNMNYPSFFGWIDENIDTIDSLSFLKYHILIRMNHDYNYEEISHILDNIIIDESIIENLTSRFPKLIPVFLKKYYNNTSFHPIYLKYIPPDIQNQFQLFLSFSNEFKKNVSFGNPNDIIMFLKNNPNFLLSHICMIKKFITINDLPSILFEIEFSERDDFILISVIKAMVYEYPDCMNIISKCLEDCITKRIKEIGKMVYKGIHSICMLLRKLTDLPIQENIIFKIQSLYSFFSVVYPSMLRHIVDFSQYPSTKIIQQLVYCCFFYDYPSIGKNLCDCFSIPLSHFSTKYLEQIFAIGVLSDAHFWASHSIIDESMLLKYFICFPVFDSTFIKTLMATKLENINTLNISIFNHMVRLRVLSKKKKNDIKISDNMQYYITNFLHPVRKSITFLVQQGFLDNALTQLLSINDHDELKVCFIHGFFFSAAAVGLLMEIKLFLYQQDPGLSFTARLWENLIEYLQSQKMLVTLFDVFRYLNRMEEAAFVAVSIFELNPDQGIGWVMLNNAETLLNDSISIRIGSSLTFNPKTSYPFRYSDCTNEQLHYKLSLITIQKKVHKWASRSGKDINQYIITNASTNILTQISSDILCLGDIKLVLNMIDDLSLQQSSVFRTAALSLSQQEFLSISSFFDALKGYPLYFEIILQYVIDYIGFHLNIRLIPELISRYVKSPDKQCYLLIEYGFLGEAFTVASMRKIKGVLPLLVFKASQIGDRTIVSLCEDILS